MTTTARAKRRIQVPTDSAGPLLRGPVDVRTERETTIVTFDLPSFPLAELRWEIKADSLVVRSADAAQGLHLEVMLQGLLNTGRFVIVVTGTIFDVRLERHDPK